MPGGLAVRPDRRALCLVRTPVLCTSYQVNLLNTKVIIALSCGVIRILSIMLSSILLIFFISSFLFFQDSAPYIMQRCHSRVMKNPEKQEGHFRIFTYEVNG